MKSTASQPETQARRVSALAPASGAADRRKPRVLVMDDDPGLLKLVVRAFEAAGFEVFSAANGRLGLKMAELCAPDLVVTDIVMPEVEGIGVILELRRKENPPKIIAVSGARLTRGPDYLSWAAHLGADRVLPKPFRMAEVIDLARSVLNPTQSNPAQSSSKTAD